MRIEETGDYHMKKDNSRILAKGIRQNNNSKETQLNNNDIIIGPSGAGKTTGYVIPNLLVSNESKIIVDTKSSLYDAYAEELHNQGYNVQRLDLDKEDSIGYNMFEYIGFNEETQMYDEQDILTLANSIVPDSFEREPFWSSSARGLLVSLIALALEEYGNGPDTWKHIIKVFGMIESPEFDKLFIEAVEKNEDSFAYRIHSMNQTVDKAVQTKSCIRSTLSTALIPFASEKINATLSKEDRVDFSKLGKEKTALFISISDMDRSKDAIYSILFAQAFQQLCKVADKSEEKELEIPVRIILDDFAANTKIENFDKVTSVLRSRNVSVSIILQSISQLNSIYSKPESITIINNCDHMLYLGGQDFDTAQIIGSRMDKPVREILEMPLESAYLFERGKPARKVERFNINNDEHRQSINLYTDNRGSEKGMA